MTHHQPAGFSTLESKPELLPQQAGAERPMLGKSLNYLIDLLESNNLPFGNLELFRRKHSRFLNLQRSREINCVEALQEWADVRLKPEWLAWDIEIPNAELTKINNYEACSELIASVDDVMLIIRMCRKLETVKITCRPVETGICASIVFNGKFRQEELRLIEDAGLNFSLTSFADSQHIKTRVNCELETTELRTIVLFDPRSKANAPS